MKALTRLGLAKADAARFEQLRVLDRVAPRLFRISRVLEELAAGAAGKRVIVIGRPGKVVTDLNLQEKLSADDIGLGQDLQPRRRPKKKDE